MSSQPKHAEKQPVFADHAELVTSLIAKVLSDYRFLKTEGLIKSIPLVNQVLLNWVEAKSKLIQKNKADSNLFNPLLQFIGIGETSHSAILGDLLSPQGSHGQGALFLESFLNHIKFPEPSADVDKWVVTVEKGRIDILLRRSNPISVVIIENKSNDAGDQENQLYRYWYQAIHSQFHTVLNYDDLTKHAFKIVYLTPNSFKQPCVNSLERPEWAANMNLPERIPINPIILTFQSLMENWLADPASKLEATKNSRLTTFLHFYSELWK